MLEPGEEVFFVVRIRNADSKPMAIERTYIPVKVYPELDEKKIMGSLYALIEAKFHQKKLAMPFNKWRQLLLQKKIVNFCKLIIQHLS